MKITMSMILEGLRKEFVCEEGENFNSNTRVSQVRVVDASTPASTVEDMCYVAKRTSQCLLIGVPYELVVLGFLPGELSAPCAIRVVNSADVRAIQDVIRRTIAGYETWGTDMLDLALHGAGLEELVDFAHGMFRNPITIIDENYRIWAHTENDIMDDELWVPVSSSDEQDTIRYSQAPEQDEQGFEVYFSSLKTNGLLESHTTNVGTKMAACATESGTGNIVGVNLVEKNRPITKADIECLKYFADIVSLKMKAMEFSWQDSSGSYFALLQDVVRGNLSNSSEFKARLNKTWITLERYFTVFVIAGRRGFLKYHQLCRVEDDLATVLPHSTNIVSSRSLVAFVNHDEILGKQELEALRRYAEDHDLAVGMSESRTDEVSLRTLLEQARFALRVRKRVFPEAYIVEFEDCRQYYLYDLCHQQPDWHRYLHNCLVTISSLDSESATALMTTLRCLVKNYGNRTTTAVELGIQRNTLRYRLSKIEEICSIDLGNPETFDHIAFSVNLADYCECNRSDNA